MVHLESNGVGRENAVGTHRRWLVKHYLGALPYFEDEVVGFPRADFNALFHGFLPIFIGQTLSHSAFSLARAL